MNINLRLPDIKATTPQEQMAEMRSYMYQLTEQLNWAFNTISDAQNTGNTSQIAIDKGNGVKESISPEEAQSTFNSIKALIIKSADIVKAYEDTIINNFKGKYFAESDFGTYIEETVRKEIKNSTSVTDILTKVATITNKDGTGTLDKLEDNIRETNAYIRRGILAQDDNGNDIVGIEIGETNAGGTFVKCARFTSDRLSFYDEGVYEVAYIGKGCLYINGNAIFLGDVSIGGYTLDTSNGIAFNWSK